VVGIPGDLLLRRPDVRSAEDALRVQSAQIGIAEAELYPHIGINGNIGLAADRLPKLFDPRSGVGTIGPSLTWNIFNYGRLLSNVRFQDYTYQQLVASYQQSILNANQDAENAMVAYLQTIQQASDLKNSADAAEKVTDYLFKPRKVGALPGMPAGNSTLAFYNQLFTVINFLVQQQDAAAQAEGNIALNLILLYRAMGGGWQMRLDHGIGPDGAPCAAAAEATPAQEPPAPAEELPPPKPLPAEEMKAPAAKP
jgi:outer membrane protein TolC